MASTRLCHRLKKPICVCERWGEVGGGGGGGGGGGYVIAYVPTHSNQGVLC